MRRQLVLLLALCSGPAAAFDTGNQLKAALEERSSKPASVLYIRGLLEGLTAGYTLSQADAGRSVRAPEVSSGLGYCLPSTVTGEQLGDVVLAHLAATPATRHEAAALLVYRAVRQAFPCPLK